MSLPPIEDIHIYIDKALIDCPNYIGIKHLIKDMIFREYTISTNLLQSALPIVLSLLPDSNVSVNHIRNLFKQKERIDVEKYKDIIGTLSERGYVTLKPIRTILSIVLFQTHVL